MKGEDLQEKAKLQKISKRILALLLVSLFCLSPLIPLSRPYDSSPNQRFNSFGSCDLKDRMLGHFVPNPNFILRPVSSFLNAGHFAAISRFDYFLSRPFPARLIESTQKRYHTAILVDSTLKERAPPLFPSGKSIL
jgi:hypothetical protein